jgi:endonuclease I
MRSSAVIRGGWRKASAQFDPQCVYTGKKLVLGASYSREHIVPVSQLKYNGTAAGRDLHNIWPADICINTLRSNYRFVNMVSVCEKEWFKDSKAGIFVPPLQARGIIARSVLYMQTKYNIPTDSVIDSEALFQWKNIPPSKYEVRHHATAAAFNRGQHNQHIWDALHVCKKYRTCIV